jgi:hypothetical protein
LEAVRIRLPRATNAREVDGRGEGVRVWAGKREAGEKEEGEEAEWMRRGVERVDVIAT